MRIGVDIRKVFGSGTSNVCSTVPKRPVVVSSTSRRTCQTPAGRCHCRARMTGTPGVTSGEPSNWSRTGGPPSRARASETSLKSRSPFFPGGGTTSVASIVATSPFLLASKKSVATRTGRSVVSASERMAASPGVGGSSFARLRRRRERSSGCARGPRGPRARRGPSPCARRCPAGRAGSRAGSTRRTARPRGAGRPRGRCRRTPSRPSPRRCPRCRRWPRRTRSRPSGSRRDRGRRSSPPSGSPSRPRSGWPRSPVARGRSPPRSPASSAAAGTPRRRAPATSAREAGPATRGPAAGRPA